MGIFGGLYFLAFLALILQVIAWFVRTERGLKAGFAERLFGMREFKPDVKKKPWSPSR